MATGWFSGARRTGCRRRCSIAIGRGLTELEPGSLDNLQMVVADADATYADLQARGIDRATAIREIVRGFYADVLARIEVEQVREQVQAALWARMDRKFGTSPLED